MIKHALKSTMMSLICLKSYGQWSAEKAHDLIYQGHDRSDCFKKIVRTAFGDEFPEDADAFSFVTLTDLKETAAHLNIARGETFADLGCGRGGPGMWIARRTGADLIGIDISTSALASAKKRIQHFGLEKRAGFRPGNFYETGLADSCCDGAVSIDALWHAPDKTRALEEIARILKPGARFVFTTWDGNIPFMPKDHKGLLENSGFEVEVYRETPGWKERQLAVYHGILDSKEELIHEMGKKHATPIIKEAKSVIPLLDTSLRVFVAARKR
ncbi:MAG: class I SAM-dependent methyltransferase [Desulfobacteraceae bacterium]|nr:class I SAM-dependent methyltransferase [Desulfobacteraceae bacterium]